MTPIVSIIIAFVGGVLAFFSPCFLPLIPAYLVYITGLSFGEIRQVRKLTIIHSIFFILGFSFVFISLGMSASILGRFFEIYRDIIRLAGGLLIIALGFYIMKFFKLPVLDKKWEAEVTSRPPGYFGSFMIGMVFALGWSPCVGPILAGVLLYASQTETVLQGFLMLTSFSLGLGLPLFLTSLTINNSLLLFRRIKKYFGVVRLVCGIFLIIIGIIFIQDYLRSFYFWIIQLVF